MTERDDTSPDIQPDDVAPEQLDDTRQSGAATTGGAVGGAAAGVVAGTLLGGPIGTAIGAAVGAVGGAVLGRSADRAAKEDAAATGVDRTIDDGVVDVPATLIGSGVLTGPRGTGVGPLGPGTDASEVEDGQLAERDAFERSASHYESVTAARKDRANLASENPGADAAQPPESMNSR